MKPFISVLYFEGMVLAFSELGDVLEFSPKAGRWSHRVDGPARSGYCSPFTHALAFEGYILLFGANGEVWKLDAHNGVPSCEWTWTLLCAYMQPGPGYFEYSPAGIPK